MPLPIEPEPLEDIKARFHLALEGVVDGAKVASGEVERPAIDRKHVFDFENGMRLIVSVDKNFGMTFLHVSVSVNEAYCGKVSDGADIMASIMADARERVADLLDRPEPELKTAFVSERGVLHLGYGWPL